MTGRVFWGSVLVIVGVLLILSNLGYIGSFSVWSLWPLLVIWPILAMLARRLFVTVHRGRRVTRVFVGRSLGLSLILLWVLAGATAQLLHNLGLIEANWGAVAGWSLPLLLVGLGVVILLRPRRSPWKWVREERVFSDRPARCVSSLVGDLHYGSRPWVFKSPMTIDLWVGDTDIDLTTAQFAPGDNYLYVSAWAGDVDIRAPEGIDVFVDASCTAGEIRVFGQERSGLGASLVTARRAVAVDADAARTGFAESAAGTGAAEDEPASGGEAAGAGETRATLPRLFITIDFTFGNVRVR